MICAQDTWRMPAKIQEQQHSYCPDLCVTMENSYAAYATTLAPNFYHLFSSPPNHPLCTIYLVYHPWTIPIPPWPALQHPHLELHFSKFHQRLWEGYTNQTRSIASDLARFGLPFSGLILFPVAHCFFTPVRLLSSPFLSPPRPPYTANSQTLCAPPCQILRRGPACAVCFCSMVCTALIGITCANRHQIYTVADACPVHLQIVGNVTTPAPLQPTTPPLLHLPIWTCGVWPACKRKWKPIQ